MLLSNIFGDRSVDDLDRRIIKELQENFPLETNPYEILADSLEDSDIRFTSTIDNQELKSVLEEIKLVLNLEYTLTEKEITIHTEW